MKLAILFGIILVGYLQNVHANPTGIVKDVQYHDVKPGDFAPSAITRRQAGQGYSDAVYITRMLLLGIYKLTFFT